jgi:hypothetical protein
MGGQDHTRQVVVWLYPTSVAAVVVRGRYLGWWLSGPDSIHVFSLMQVSIPRLDRSFLVYECDCNCGDMEERGGFYSIN